MWTTGIIEWCVARRHAAKDADLWMLMWEEVRRTHDAGIRVGVEHVKAHRSKKEKQEMSLFERFVTEGIGRTDELAKRWSKCWMEETWRRSEPAQFIGRERRPTRRCRMQPAFTVWWDEWHDYEELKTKDDKKKVDLRVQKMKAEKHRTGWFCGHKYISLQKVCGRTVRR